MVFVLEVLWGLFSGPCSACVHCESDRTRECCRKMTNYLPCTNHLRGFCVFSLHRYVEMSDFCLLLYDAHDFIYIYIYMFLVSSFVFYVEMSDFCLQLYDAHDFLQSNFLCVFHAQS